MGRRNVTKNLLEQEIELEKGDIIARVIEPRGKNLHLIEYAIELVNPKDKTEAKSENEFESTLCQLPTKFRNMVWVKRGSYVVINLYEEKDGKGLTEGKVGGSIKEVLFPYHIKRLKIKQQWPEVYDNEAEEKDEDEDEDIPLGNPNRRIEEEDISSSDEE
ncbi:hypothetical protein K502DRAFT_346556 [Neoconidiobolus thromboides FSU 785]|nr:hypothetical protein K502DRAFT_346556 [Neoconidiobolus thromboides FSU 785]